MFLLSNNFVSPSQRNLMDGSVAQEFAFFLKKRSQLEEEHASGMKKLCRMSNDVMRRPEHRQGTWAHAYEDVMVMHERMCENSIQFAGSLHHMHEDLLEMAALAEKSRKGWKQNGLTAETRIQELEQQMKKSKARYDQLAEEYDRVRTGDSRSSGKGFFKSVKSAAQQEEELLRKLQTADQDYRSRVDMFRHERASVTSTTRPDAVKGLQDLIRECDAGLSLQLQKFASFNEKLVLSNGLIMSPIKSQTVKTSPYRSLREIASSVDNEKDLQDFLMMQHKLLPPRFPEPKYERNPILNPPNNHTMYPAQPQGQQPVQQAGTSIGGTPHMLQPVISTLGQQHQMGKPPAGSVTPASQGMGVRPGMGLGMGSGSAQSPTMSLAGSTMGASSMGSSPIGPGFRPPGASTVPGMQYQWVSSGSPQQFAQAQQHGRSFSQGSGLMVGQEKTQTGPQQLVRNSAGPPPRFNGTISSQAPQLGSLPFQIQEQGQLSPPQQTQGLVQGQIHQQLLSQQQRGSSPSQNTGLSQGSHASLQNPISNAPSDPSSLQVARSVSPPTAPMATPSRPVFGVALDKLYERDKVPVPMVVYRCIQAIDLFGLNMEGIYRLSGSQAHVQKLRILFDTAGVDGNSPDTDFRNPENFFHDVNSVAGLLKQFFRDLPDPLFTRRMYGDFIEAARRCIPRTLSTLSCHF